MIVIIFLLFVIFLLFNVFLLFMIVKIFLLFVIFLLFMICILFDITAIRFHVFGPSGRLENRRQTLTNALISGPSRRALTDVHNHGARLTAMVPCGRSLTDAHGARPAGSLS